MRQAARHHCTVLDNGRVRILGALLYIVARRRDAAVPVFRNVDATRRVLFAEQSFPIHYATGTCRWRAGAAHPCRRISSARQWPGSAAADVLPVISASLLPAEPGVRIGCTRRCHTRRICAGCVLPLGLSRTGGAVGIDAERDLLRRHQAILPDIPRDTELLPIHRAYAALPAGFLVTGIGIIVDALRRQGLRSDAERRRMAACRRQQAQQNRACPACQLELRRIPSRCHCRTCLPEHP
jgi:hypothetical protein